MELSATLRNPTSAAPRVAAYPRHDAAEYSFTVQVGDEWCTVKWDAADTPNAVAQRLSDVVAWMRRL